MSVPCRREPFADRISTRILARKSRLVVGLDPVLEWLPARLRDGGVEDALEGFCRGVIEAVVNHAVAVKPQIAFFERHGWKGLRALRQVVEQAAAADLPVILDAKRGDIGSTAAAYADAFLTDDPETPGPFVDALTINPYLGGDSLTPFLDRARAGNRGLFVLTRTSNPGGADFQTRETDGEPLFLAVARAIERWGNEPVGEFGYGPVGLVAGATFPRELERIRSAAPHAYLLLPGLGAQGGKARDLRPAFDSRGLGGLPAVSRSIIYAFRDHPEAPWEESVEAAARRHREEVEEILR